LPGRGCDRGKIRWVANRETESGEIYLLAVDPDYQQRGIGLALVDFAVDRIAHPLLQGAAIARAPTRRPAGQPV
jgi:ribosomal protein S18 acetylase RimI-like enzyme